MDHKEIVDNMSIGIGSMREFRVWLKDGWKSKYPLATDDVHKGVRRMSRDKALSMKYIEACPKQWLDRIVVDIDNRDAYDICMWNEPRPNFLTSNRCSPHYGYGHATILLSHPVPATENSRHAPLALYKAVQRALTKHWNGDRAYGHLLTKNPLCGKYTVDWISDRTWSLQELADMLTKCGCMSKDDAKLVEHGESRNCDMFDAVRKWSYRHVFEYSTCNSFRDACLDQCNQCNAKLASKLPTSELRSIANSVARHVWDHPLHTQGYEAYRQNFANIQKARGFKSAKARRKQMDKFIAMVQKDESLLAKPIQELADMFRRSIKTIYRWLKQVDKHLVRRPKLVRKHDARPPHVQKHATAQTKQPIAVQNEEGQQLHVCPYCFSPLWSNATCTCMLD